MKKLTCWLCYESEQGAHGPVTRQWCEQIHSFVPVCYLHCHWLARDNRQFLAKVAAEDNAARLRAHLARERDADWDATRKAWGLAQDD